MLSMLLRAATSWSNETGRVEGIGAGTVDTLDAANGDNCERRDDTQEAVADEFALLSAAAAADGNSLDAVDAATEDTVHSFIVGPIPATSVLTHIIQNTSNQ